MEGVAVGRSVDLSVLSGYDELIHVVDEIFDMKGELTPRIKWQLVYKDDEGDMMLLGDYPWTLVSCKPSLLDLHFYEWFNLTCLFIAGSFVRWSGSCIYILVRK